MPKTHTQFASLSGNTLNDEYCAKDLIKYFVPFGAYIDIEDIEECDTNHFVFSVEETDKGKKYNSKLQSLYDIGFKLINEYSNKYINKLN